MFVLPETVLTVEGSLSAEPVLGTEIEVSSLLMMNLKSDNVLPMNCKHSTFRKKDCMHWNFCRTPMGLMNCGSDKLFPSCGSGPKFLCLYPTSA